MRGPIAWFARNHVAANLLMALFIVGGLLLRRVDVEEGRRMAREVEARLG